MTLQFNVNTQTLTPFPTNKKVASDSKNYLKAKFVFQTSEWRGGLPYALFTYNGKTYKKILGAEDDVAANECYVPAEVIKPGAFSVSVFNHNTVSTNMIEVPVADSGYTEELQNGEATPTVMEQINNLMYKYATLCDQILDDCRNIEEKLKGGNK